MRHACYLPYWAHADWPYSTRTAATGRCFSHRPPWYPLLPHRFCLSALRVLPFWVAEWFLRRATPLLWAYRRLPATRAPRLSSSYSHSIVASGFALMSYTTLFIPFT